MNKFTPPSNQWLALRSFILLCLLICSGSAFLNAQCLVCNQDTVYNMSFNGASCEKILDYDDFEIDTTGCGVDYVLIVVHASTQDTLVNGKSDTIGYAYARDSLSFKFYIEGEADTCRGSIVLCDTVPPVVNVQDTFTFLMEDDSCMTDVPLPMDGISDNCGDTTLTIYVPGQDTLFGGTDTLRNVRDGTYTVIYEATDSCNAPVRDTMILLVDGTNDSPLLVCSPHVVTTYTNAPFTLGPNIFVDSVADDCGMSLYYKIKKMDDPVSSDCYNSDNPENMFDDEFTVCCEDMPSVMMRVRVYDRDPGSGPVPEDTLDGHFTECMTELIVQDKIDPTLVAPTDLSVECGTVFDTSNLSAYGEIAPSQGEREDIVINGQVVGQDGYAEDNCQENLSVTETVVLDTNICGLGTIYRIFKATDGVGNMAVDTQTIEITLVDPFGEDNIDWPDDVTLYNCAPFPGPDSTGYPVYDTVDCSMVAWHYNDKIFDIQNGCYKILRQWTVIDWCQNDPGVQDDDWKFMHEQVLKIHDTVPPSFPALATVTKEHMDPDCEDIFVSVPVVFASDCPFYSPLYYSISIDYNDDSTIDTTFQGNDASGNYPTGTHRLIYTAEDDCGNIGQAERIVDVIDRKPPNGTVIGQASVNLSLMNGTPMVMVSAGMFNPSPGSSATLQDNCTSNDNLRFSYSSDINDDELILDCDNVGDTVLTIYVWDEAGNSSSVTTTLQVTDLDSLCPQGSIGASISGQVMVSTVDQPMPGVEIQVEQDGESWTNKTNSEGRFHFGQMAINSAYTIWATYDPDYLNGVSTYDLVLIQRHILGIDNFSNSYLYIAADVNNDRKVSATDLVELRKVILGQKQAFSNNTSWRFIPSSYVFSMTPGKPLPDFPEHTTIELNEEGAQVELTAVKIGDVNGSMEMDGLNSIDERKDDPIYFEYKNIQMGAGEIRDVEFYAAKPESFLGFQGTFVIDPKYAEVVYVESDVLPDLDTRSIRTNKKTGHTRFSWYQAIPVKCGRVEPIMKWKIRVKRDCMLEDILSIKNGALDNEVYDAHTTENVLELRKQIDETDDRETALEFERVYPNPFEDVTNVTFKAAHQGTLVFRVIDSYGKEQYKEEFTFKRGSNHLQVNLEDLSISGLLYYQLEYDKQVFTGKLIKAIR